MVVATAVGYYRIRRDDSWQTGRKLKAEKAAREARAAIAVCAIQAAKRAVKAQIRAEGLRLCEFTGREITIRAQAWLAEHPEMFAEARARAVELGYAIPTI
jgi:hypothetical protein